METFGNGGQRKDDETAKNNPSEVINIAGRKVDLAAALSPDWSKRKQNVVVAAKDQDRKPGDEAAHRLLYILEDVSVIIDEYRLAMPRLFEHASIPGGGYDPSFIGLAFQAFDKTAAKMGLASNEDPMLWRSNLSKDKREVFFGRAYGYVEGLKEQVLDRPASPGSDLAERKKQLVEYGLKSTWLPPATKK